MARLFLLTLTKPTTPTPHNHHPNLLTAETGYAAYYFPAHAIARTLIDASGRLPIAAPSANKF